ncbi:MAG: DMT family transporter [Bacteroidota bacterium]
MRNKHKAHLALIGTNIFFAINFSAVKYLINDDFIKPFGLNFIRMLFTTLLLWIFYWANPNKEKINKIHYKRFVLCALLGIVINQLLFIKGLSMTFSIHASLLMLTTPIFITLIAAWILKESLNKFKILGLIMGVIGAVVLVIARKNTGNGTDIFWGDIFIIINAISYSYYFILVIPLMKRYKAITVIRILFTIGTIIALPVCWSQFISIPWHNYAPMQFGILALIIFGGTFLAYVFNLYGIKYLGASVSGSYIYTQPFFATAIAIIFLNESLDLYKIVGAFFIFLGVYLSKRSAHSFSKK